MTETEKIAIYIPHSSDKTYPLHNNNIWKVIYIPHSSDKTDRYLDFVFDKRDLYPT